MDDDSLQDVTGLCKELIKAPALSLLYLQDVGQDGHQLALQPPTHTQDMKIVRARTRASKRNLPGYRRKAEGPGLCGYSLEVLTQQREKRSLA